MAKPQLVIFDCDGVLVDSEMLSAAVLKGLMTEVGLPITDEIFRSDFLGRSFANAAAKAEIRFNRPLPDDFQQRYRDRLLAKMEGELRPMAGVFEVLSSMTAPYCLATSSSPQRLELSLRVTGLAPFFAGRCSTASEVANGKPAPDLILHAARKMGIGADRAIVIEDSEMGILSARRSGAAAWHFAGGAHVRAGYALPPDLVPDRVIDSMASLRSAFAALGLCRPDSL